MKITQSYEKVCKSDYEYSQAYFSIDICELSYPTRDAINGGTYAGTKEVLGRSVFSENGSDFKILSTNSSGVQTDKDAEHRFLIIGGTHGDEIMTTEFVAWLYKRTASGQGRFSQMGDNVVFDFIPVLNIDNFGKSRYNKKPG